MTAQRRDTSIGLHFPLKGLQISAAELAGDASAMYPFMGPIRQAIQWWYQHEEWLEISTSGSTGNPRTVSFNRKQILGSISRTAQALGLMGAQKALLCIDPNYIGGKMMLFRALQSGMDLICVEPTSNPLLEDLPLLDFAAFVPLQVDTILSNPASASRFTSIETVIIGGAAINPSLENKLSGSRNRVFQTYGMTETLSHIALRNLSMGEQDFKPLPGIRITKDGRGCLIAEIPEFERPVVTNDLIEVTGNDRFKWIGRIDNVINSGGVKIQPESLESKISDVLEKFETISGFFIAGKPDERLGEQITLVIECRRKESPDIHAIRNSIQSTINRFEMPREIRMVEEFTKTPGGKLDRRATLAKSYLIDTDSGHNHGM